MKSLILIFITLTFQGKNVINIWSDAIELTQQEAERILGESCYLTHSTDASANGIRKYKSTYLTDSSTETAKQTALDYIFESYTDEAVARKTFETFQTSYQTSQGFEQLTNVGDEAFFHSDGQNSCLVNARKSNKMIRIKLNRITRKTSLTELRKVASEILLRM